MEEKEIFNEEELFQFPMKEEGNKMPSTEWWMRVYESAEDGLLEMLDRRAAEREARQAQTSLQAGTGIAATSGEEQEK